MNFKKISEFMTKKVVYAKSTDTVLDIAEFMYNKGIGSIIVKKESVPEGIMTERDIVRNCVMGKKSIFRTTVSEIMSDPIICTDQDTSVLDCCHMMRERNIKKLIISNGDQVIGVATMTDVVHNVNNLTEDSAIPLKKVPISNVMSKEIYYADQNDAIIDITALMKRLNIGSVVVMNQGMAIGILSERDIVKNCVVGEKNFIKLIAKDIMSKPIISIGKNSTMLDAANLMKERKIKKLVVKDETGKICGIITQTDVIYKIDMLF